MEKLINNIIEKVWTIFHYDKRFTGLLSQNTEVKLQENK